MPRKSIAFKIVEHLTQHGIEWPGGPANAAIYRCYVGHWQRARGAWIWQLVPRKARHSIYPSVGSTAPAKLAARHGFEVFVDRVIGGYELFPLVHPWAKERTQSQQDQTRTRGPGPTGKDLEDVEGD